MAGGIGMLGFNNIVASWVMAGYGGEMPDLEEVPYEQPGKTPETPRMPPPPPPPDVIPEPPPLITPKMPPEEQLPTVPKPGHARSRFADTFNDWLENNAPTIETVSWGIAGASVISIGVILLFTPGGQLAGVGLLTAGTRVLCPQ